MMNRQERLAAGFNEAAAAYRDGNPCRVAGLCKKLLEQQGARPDLLNLKAISLARQGYLYAALNATNQALELLPGVFDPITESYMTTR
jgi:hypothetical protein